MELFDLRKLLILWTWTPKLRGTFMMPIFQSTLSLPHLNTAFSYYQQNRKYFLPSFFTCSLPLSFITSEFKLRKHFSECFFYLLQFLEDWVFMWSLAYSSWFPKKEGKSFAQETFPLLPNKGQNPIVTNWWSSKWWISFTPGTMQSGGQCLHSIWKLSWQNKEAFHSPLLVLRQGINPHIYHTNLSLLFSKL